MAATTVKSRQVLDGTLTSADIANNAIITALIASGAVTFSKLAIYATNPCLEDDGSGNMRVQVDGLSGTPPVPIGGTITRTASGLAVSSVPTTAMTGLVAIGSMYAGKGLASGAPAVQAPGTNGQYLVFDSSAATTRLRWQDAYLGFKNKIINGRFDLWQRNTTFSLSGTTAAYTADRWRGYAGASGAATIARASFTLGQVAVPGEPAYNIDWNQTTGATADTPQLEQRIEDVRTLAGQTVTVSFWAIAITTAFNLTVTLVQGFGSGGSPSSDVSTAVGTAALTTSWQQFTYTVTLPSITGKTIGTNLDSSLKLNFAMPASVIRRCNISTVQVEAGNVASDFDLRPIGAEILLCQRYYYKTYDYSVVPGTASAGGIIQGVSSGVICCIQADLPVLMRVSPTVSIWSFSGVASKMTQNGGAEIGAFADTWTARGGTISNSVNAVDTTKYFCYVVADAEL